MQGGGKDRIWGFVPGKCLEFPTEGTNWRVQQLPPATTSVSGGSHGARGEVNEPCGTGPLEEGNSTVLTFIEHLVGKICLDPPALPDGKQQAEQPLARHCLLAAPPHPGQPCAREVPARHCCAWKMSFSEADIVVCSRMQLHSELFNCTDIAEAQTAMPLFFLG